MDDIVSKLFQNSIQIVLDDVFLKCSSKQIKIIFDLIYCLCSHFKSSNIIFFPSTFIMELIAQVFSNNKILISIFTPFCPSWYFYI